MVVLFSPMNYSRSVDHNTFRVLVDPSVLVDWGPLENPAPATGGWNVPHGKLCLPNCLPGYAPSVPQLPYARSWLTGLTWEVWTWNSVPKCPFCVCVLCDSKQFHRLSIEKILALSIDMLYLHIWHHPSEMCFVVILDPCFLNPSLVRRE